MRLPIRILTPLILLPVMFLPAGAATAAAPPTTPQVQELKISGNGHLTPTNPITLKAKKLSKSTPILACFDFTFTGDLLDPGKGLPMTPKGEDSGPGFENFSAGSMATRTLCVDDPAFLAPIADGNSAEQFLVRDDLGASDTTLTVSSVVLTLTYE